MTASVGSLATSVTGGNGNGNAQATTSSKGAAAPVQTWGVMEVLGLSGAVGILGVAVGL